MSQLQYMPGDPRLIDQLVYELKSKGIFDQFRKDCIADVDTRPAYQNLRQRVESSVTTFLSRQKWKPDLNKNQLREKLRKHILDGNYLEQGVERIVDQVVNPKVASVFIPQVEDLVYNYLGIKRVKTSQAETSSEKDENNDLLPTDLEAVSPGSVKSGKDEAMETDEIEVEKMDTEDSKADVKEDEQTTEMPEKKEEADTSEQASQDAYCLDNNTIPLPAEIKAEDIPLPDDSPPKFNLLNIDLPKDSEIPLPKIPLPDIAKEEIPLPESEDKENFFKPINHSDDDDSSSDSSIIRNMSPLTPVRNFDDENSCDAQQGFENNTEIKQEEEKESSNNTFKFSLESIQNEKEESKSTEKKEDNNLSSQFENQVNINATPMYDESSNSNNLQIDYESDANSKLNADSKQESSDSKKERSSEKKSHKSSHHSRDSHRHSSSSKRSDSKYSSSKDRKDSKSDKKTSKDGHSSKSKSSHRERSRERSDKKDSRDSSRHRHSSSHKSSKDSKSKSSSSQRQSSSKHSDEKKSSSSSSHRDRSDKSSSKDHKSSRDSKSSSHRSDKDRKSSSSRSKDDKEKEKKEKKDQDDHYSLSGRGNNSRRSTDRDSNDGNSSSSKGSNNNHATKTTENKKEKSSSKSENTTSSSDSTSPGDKEIVDSKTDQAKELTQVKPVRVENHLETPISKSPMRFMPEVVLKKPKFASNLEEAKKMMKMRKFLDEEQRKMNQEAALLLEFQANVRPSLSQVYSSIPGPELEFACVNNSHEEDNHQDESIEENKEEEASSNKNENNDQEDSGEETIESIFEIQKEIDRHSDVQEEGKETSEPENKKLTEFYEVTVVAEELSEVEDDAASIVEDEGPINEDRLSIEENTDKEGDESTDMPIDESIDANNDNVELKYFDVHEKYESAKEKDDFSTFLKNYTEKCSTNKLFLINCNSYHTNLVREAAEIFGNFEIVSYTRNGHLKLPKANKNIDFDNKEVVLPLLKSPNSCVSPNVIRSPLFSPVKSECSFELSSDYDDKLKNMANTTSRQEIMEIILGGVIDGSPPKIDICNESNIEHSGAKRKLDEDESDNNNEQLIIPNKIRKTSCSDQISSTTEEPELISSTHIQTVVRSKFFGKSRRVGLPKPKRTVTPNSPSSDRSVENYEQTTVITKTINGKLKPQRNKVQRYDTSDLYKPKLPFLSRRNHVT